MIPTHQWLESWADTFDEETGELVSEGGTAYCMLAIATEEEWDLIREAYNRPVWSATRTQGINPVTGDLDSRFDKINVQWKTMDIEEFSRLGGDPGAAESHGYDTHPNTRRPKPAPSAA